MALEDQVAQLSQNVGNLVNLVSTQANNWNAMVQNKINELEQWKQDAIAGYPAWNLFSNAKLDKVNSDGSPKGFYYIIWNLSVTATVIKEVDPPYWGLTAGNFMRLSVSVANQNASPIYRFNSYGQLQLFPSSFVRFPANAPIQRATVGVDYRVITKSGNIDVKLGAFHTSLDLTKTDWTSVYQQNITYEYDFFAIYLKEPTATLTIDLRNIYLNLGDANYYTLGIPQLTDLNI
jgi:hypothetical protein